MFVVVSATTDDRVPASLAPVAVGAALAVAVSVGAPVTGGVVNPVRALGPALIAGQLPNIWIYIVGPLLGGVAAVRLRPHPRQSPSPRLTAPLPGGHRGPSTPAGHLSVPELVHRR